MILHSSGYATEEAIGKRVEERRMKQRILINVRNGIVLLVVGGLAYNLIEILWRGYSHWTMFLVGGVCFQMIGRIHTALKKWNVVKRCALCSLGVTVIEFISGCLFNLALGMQVWDYSYLPFNLLGQVCLLYSVLWGGLSLAAVPLYTLLLRWLNAPRGKARTADADALHSVNSGK